MQLSACARNHKPMGDETPIQRLIILGNGTFAMEVADLVSDLPQFRVEGFAASVPPYQAGDTLLGLPVYWVDELARLTESHVAICGIVTTKRRAFIEQARACGMKFVSVIHPTARVSRLATIGEGTLISAGVLVSTHTRIGNHVVVNRGAIIGHHDTIQDYATISPGANIAGAATIGEQAWIGMGAQILEKRSIGEKAIVGAGAVVTRNVPARTQVMGSPARVFQEDVDGY
jgi:acetyltransferase EpsM